MQRARTTLAYLCFTRWRRAQGVNGEGGWGVAFGADARRMAIDDELPKFTCGIFVVKQPI